MNDDDYQYVRGMVHLLVRKMQAASDSVLTREMIEQAVAKVLASGLVEADEHLATKLVQDMESLFATWIGHARALVDPNTHRPWVARRRADIQPWFWRRYSDWLLEGGWSQSVVTGLDTFTDKILDHVSDPATPGAWDRRGLVVGHVQSGKTANYTGLLCKAADAGYKVIVVLAGMHNSLRTQTQIRLEEGFLGYETRSGKSTSSERPAVGVGLLANSIETRANAVTTRASTGDFNAAFAHQFSIDVGKNDPPLLFVVKKNGSVLKNLLSWVSASGNQVDQDGQRYVSGVPLLVIDDEADQGSIDTRLKERDENGVIDDDHDPSVLNERIRKLLKLFDQSAYVAYTATPFANVLIHSSNATKDLGEDLFPRDFIVSLPPPTNYFGPSELFGELRIFPGIRCVEDATTSEREQDPWMPHAHKKEHAPLYRGEDRAPPSLEDAVRDFVLVCTARAARGDAARHNSMLVHVTRFTLVQDKVCTQVQEVLQRLRRAIMYAEKSDGTLETLRERWENDFRATTQKIAASDCPEMSWDQLLPHLAPSVAKIQVHKVNGEALDALDYQASATSGLSVIAIGGDKLSRGLTLEGLSVSYFLRASRMYDTLMQMGRWFGYRPRYVDLCRIYTTEDMIDWFQHITAANEELRREFNAMANANETPRQYGQRVLSHPSLLVTSQVKMRDGEKIDVTFAGSICETIAFHREEDKIRQNFEALSRLVRSLDPSAAQRLGDAGNRLLWTNVSAEHVVAFLEQYRAHEGARRVKPLLLKEYIQELRKKGELTDWTVAVVGGTAQLSPFLTEIAGPQLRPVIRKWHETSLDNGRLKDSSRSVFRIGRLVSPADEQLGLARDQVSAALEATIKRFEEDQGRRKERPTQPDGVFLRRVRSQSSGLLLIYPISPLAERDAGDVPAVEPPHPAPGGENSPPFVGVAFSFPGSKEHVKVSYVVNNVYFQQEFGGG